MIAPFLEAGLDGAIYGFGVETGLHLLRIITAGVFDRFPGLRIIVGHCGEALPFWLYRIDYMHRATVASARYAFMKPLQRKPSDYLRENVYVTNSGVAWEPAIMFCRSVLGADRVMYAMDYPYQFVRDEVAGERPAAAYAWRKRSSTSRATPSACSVCRRAATLVAAGPAVPRGREHRYAD